MAHDIHPDRACGRTGGWRPRRSRPRAQMCFQNTEFMLGYFYRTDQRDWLCRWKEAGTEGAWDGLRTTRQASWSGRRFFYFFRSNPLISLESKKGIQGNASFFPFFSLHFLARDSPAGCISGSRPGRRARPALTIASWRHCRSSRRPKNAVRRRRPHRRRTGQSRP